MTDTILEKIWEVLVRCCGADEDGLEDFILAASFGDERRRVTEYRFQGVLGFGGKVWVKPGETPYVSCYQEDETPERREMILRANGALRGL